MRARLGIWDRRAATFKGYLPTIDLQFSAEVGGGGNITATALMSDIDALDAWDCTAVIECETSPGVYAPACTFAFRHQYTHRAGFRTFTLQGTGLLEALASETVLMPEYVVKSMPRGAGTERAIGWQSSAYDPADDPDEPWDAVYETSRTTMPPFWPSGTGARWISASGSSDETESKYFRTWLTITGSKRLVEFYLSSDESATLFVAGERIIETSSTETGKKEFTRNKMVLYPGTYAVGVFTQTVISKGGDGQDPVLVAAAVLDSEGDPSSWVLASNEDDWVACRRDDEPPDDVPPGPTPGAAIRYLVTEAQERRVSIWENVTLGFTDTHDSYGAPWADVSERLLSYGQTSYWDIFQSLAESDECDVWLGPGFVLHAAKKQGQPKSLVFTETHFHEFHTKGTPGGGSWVMAQAWDGWLTESLDGYIRREYSLELGEALTRATGRKIAQASLQDRWRWDASGSMNPPQAGWIPFLDFNVGDSMQVDYRAVVHNISITSISARAGEGGLLLDIEATEWPNDGDVLAAHAPRALSPGLFAGLEVAS